MSRQQAAAHAEEVAARERAAMECSKNAGAVDASARPEVRGRDVVRHEKVPSNQGRLLIRLL